MESLADDPRYSAVGEGDEGERQTVFEKHVQELQVGTLRGEKLLMHHDPHSPPLLRLHL